MNTSFQAQNAYHSSHSSVKTPTSQEYDAIARITSSLKAANEGPARADAVHRNRELWTTLASDVATTGNGLPSDLRARIFYLAEFTTAHSRKVLNDLASTDLLIEINTSVMRGLRAQGQRG